jgi:hypothetical protein
MVFSDNTFNYGDCNFIDNACSPFDAIKKCAWKGLKRVYTNEKLQKVCVN